MVQNIGMINMFNRPDVTRCQSGEWLKSEAG
jgi:hypothetical protein